MRAAITQESTTGADPLRRLAAEGWLAALLPREDGGAGRSVTEVAAALADAFTARGDGGLALAWAGHTLGCALPIARLGADAQRRRLLPGLAAGATLGAWAHHEVGVVGEALGLRTYARRTPQGWVLDGRKVQVVNAGRADLFLVTAITDPGRGPAGVSAFLVARGAAGLGVRGEAGPAAAALGEVSLTEVHVPEDMILGAPGDGLGRAFRLVQRWERGLAAAPWLGLLRAGLAHAAAQARTQVRLGAPLARSQAHRARLADAAIRLALCERVQARAASLLDGGDLDLDPAGDLELASGRLFLGESIAWLARELARLGEPATLAADHPSARLAADVAAAGLVGVPQEVLRSIVAAALTGLG